MSDTDRLGAIASIMEDWTPEVRTALGKLGRLHLGEPGEDETIRLVYGILGAVKAQLDIGISTSWRRAPLVTPPTLIPSESDNE